MNGSSQNRNELKGYLKTYLLLCVLCIAFLGSFYGKVILNPNSYMFNASGDGIKNYYVYAYYVQNNQSYTSFEGHNYPFGESVLYTDGHPLIAFSIKVMSGIFPGAADYSIGILNFWMLFSFFLCATFLFLIFRELNIYPLLSAFAAFAIMVLSPQVFRLTGHYALSYGFVIPLTIYLVLKHQTTKRSILCIAALFIHLFCCFFTHPYLGIISTAIVLIFLFIKWILNFRNHPFYSRKNLGLLIVSIVPLVLFYVIARILDTHSGRTTNPYGFFDYYADIDTLFLPNHPPLKFLLKLLPPFTQTWEGWSYIGVTGILTCVVITFMFVRFLLKKKKGQLFFRDNSLLILFIASLVLVLFSMGVPFRFLPKSALDHFSFLKQFRSIGRFAWVFFFMINILAIYLLDQFIRNNVGSGKKWMKFFIILIPALIFYEGYFYHKEVSREISKSPNLYSFKNVPDELGNVINVAKTSSSQAIIPLPYYNTGSENFMKEGSDKIYTASMILSYYTGIPLMGNLIPRSSVCESKMLIQVFSDDFYKKEILTRIKSDLPFLVLYSKEDLNRNENLLKQKGTVLYEGPEYILYSVSKELLFRNSSQNEIDKFKNIKGELLEKNGFLTNDTTSWFFYDGFENMPSGNTFRGKGGISTKKNNPTVLADIYCNKFTRDEKYFASFWIYNEGKNCGQDILTNLDFKIYHTLNGSFDQIATIKPQTSMVISNNWTLVEINFRVEKREGSVQFRLDGNDITDGNLFVDEVFIYPAAKEYYRIEQQTGDTYNELFYNNHRIAR